MAAATGRSTSTAAGALRELTALGLLASAANRGPRSGRKLVDPEILLDSYAGAASRLRSAQSLRIGVPWKHPLEVLEETGERWDKAGFVWAATGAMGAAVLAPYLTEFGEGEVYVDVPSEAGLRVAAARVGLEPLEGGRLVLRPFPTATSRRRRTMEEGIWIAPWPRIYSDLQHVGVRGEEAAEHLRETVRKGP